MSVAEQFAGEQTLRFSGLPGFPRVPEGIRELKGALMLCDTERICKLIVGDWLARNKKSPTPADLLAMVWAANEPSDRSKRKCRVCGGCGCMTEWYLVTYAANTYRIRRREKLYCGYEEAMDFARKIEAHPVGEEHQTVLSAARPCDVCSHAEAGDSDGAR